MDFDMEFANEMMMAVAKLPVIANADHAPLEGGEDPAFGTVRWRTLFSADKTSTSGMVMGVAEFGPSGVRVNAVGPGVVETPLTAPIQADPDWHGAYAAKSVFNRWATAEEMVGPTVFLASDAASFVTGTTLTPDGGFHLSL